MDGPRRDRGPCAGQAAVGPEEDGVHQQSRGEQVRPARVPQGLGAEVTYLNLRSRSMSYSRREFGKLALAGLPATAILGRTESLLGAFAQAKPNSLINGVQIGAITYSFREMPDQS